MSEAEVAKCGLYLIRQCLCHNAADPADWLAAVDSDANRLRLCAMVANRQKDQRPLDQLGRRDDAAKWPFRRPQHMQLAAR